LALTYAISYQIEHHMFPALNPGGLQASQPIVMEVSKKHGIDYHYFPSETAAIVSVFKQFKRLSHPSTDKSKKTS
jgi:linoleoyl-CoA desaturase